MCTRPALALLLALASTASARTGFGIPPPVIPAAVALSADDTVIGRVAAVEKDAVEADLHPTYGLKPQKTTYRVAVIKIEKPLIGADGVTQVRVGFPDGALRTPGDGPRPTPFKLDVGVTACFLLQRHPKTDFYVPADSVAPIVPTDPNYDKVLSEIKVVAKALEDPVAALKSASQADRVVAAHTVLYRWRIPARGGVGVWTATQDFPAEENRLVLGVIAEMPWTRKSGPGYSWAATAERRLLWHNFVHAQKYGFKPPESLTGPGSAGRDRNKIWDEATATFLKENVDRIKLQRPIQKK